MHGASNRLWAVILIALWSSVFTSTTTRSSDSTTSQNHIEPTNSSEKQPLPLAPTGQRQLQLSAESVLANALRDISSPSAYEPPAQLQLEITDEPEIIPNEDLLAVCFDGVSELAYISGQPSDIYLMSVDGSNQRRLTDDEIPDSNLSWSPDGASLAYASQPSGNVQIWVMDADGNNRRALTAGVGSYQPSWSPTGAQIVYVRYILGQGDVWIMDADGRNQLPLSTNDLDEQWPTWSPDGNQIALVVQQGSGSAIVLMNVDGSNQRELVTGGLNVLPQWSPDGTTIAFASNRNGQFQLYLVAADGTNLQNLSNNNAIEGPTGWSPDGRFIVFFSNRASAAPDAFDIYVMTPDGANIRKLTEVPGLNENARWRPCSDTLIENTPTAAVVPQCTVSAADNVNLRSGPGTNFGVADRLTPDQVLTVVGQTTGTDDLRWWQLESRVWVRSDVVAEQGRCNEVPVLAP